MKKVLVLTLCAALILSFAACGNKNNSTSPSSVISDITSEETPLAPGVNNTNTRIGLGIVSTTSESTAAANDTAGSANFNATVCGLSVDDNGKILAVRFDTVKTGVGFDVSGAFTGDINSEIKTKRELGDNYGIGAVSEIGKEWYEQIDALEDWMVGKTVNEVMSMKVYERDEAHQHVPDEEDLKTSVTISVTDQLRALEKAYADATGNLSNFTSSYFDDNQNNNNNDNTNEDDLNGTNSAVQ